MRQAGYGSGGYGTSSTNPFSSGSYQNPDAEWDELSQQIANGVQQVQNNTQQLQKMVQQLGTAKDTESFRAKLRTTVDSTKDLAKETSENMKRLQSMPHDSSKRAQQQRMTKEFQSWLKEFSAVTKLSAKREREFPVQESARGGGQDDWSGISAAGGLTTENFYEQDALDAQRRQADFQSLEMDRENNSQVIQERDAAIREIETAVLEVNDIFTDLANLAAEQTEMIDSIESNIVVTDQRVEKGVSELAKANKYQKSARKKMCCMMLCVLVLGGGVVAYLFLGKIV